MTTPASLAHHGVASWMRVMRVRLGLDALVGRSGEAWREASERAESGLLARSRKRWLKRLLERLPRYLRKHTLTRLERRG